MVLFLCSIAGWGQWGGAVRRVADVLFMVGQSVPASTILMKQELLPVSRKTAKCQCLRPRGVCANSRLFEWLTARCTTTRVSLKIQ